MLDCYASLLTSVESVFLLMTQLPSAHPFYGCGFEYVWWFMLPYTEIVEHATQISGLKTDDNEDNMLYLLLFPLFNQSIIYFANILWSLEVVATVYFGCCEQTLTNSYMCEHFKYGRVQQQDIHKVMVIL